MCLHILNMGSFETRAIHEQMKKTCREPNFLRTNCRILLIILWEGWRIESFREKMICVLDNKANTCLLQPVGTGCINRLNRSIPDTWDTLNQITCQCPMNFTGQECVLTRDHLFLPKLRTWKHSSSQSKDRNTVFQLQLFQL